MAAQQERNKALVSRFFEEVWNRNNLGLADQLLMPNYLDHNAPPGSSGGVDGYKQSVAMFRSAFPDLVFTLDQMLAEDDRIVIRLTGRGTHNGSFMGIAPTGRQVAFTGMTVIRFEGDRIAERWGLSDMAGLRQQLTAVPPPDGEVAYVAPDESHSTTRVLGVFNVCKATKADTNGAFSFFISTVPSGEGVPIHTHLQEDEAYYILEGEFEMYDITHNKTIRVGPESYVYVPRRTEHGFKCVSPNAGKMVLLITPGGLEGFFEGIGQVITDIKNPPPPISGAPDFVKAAEVAAQYNITFVVPR